jgi:hypothetical protein
MNLLGSTRVAEEGAIMRRPSAFRALAVETLEDRLVLSHVSAPATAAALHQRAPATPQHQLTARVNAAYTAFVSNFGSAVSNDLYLPSVTGSGGANTAMFSQQLGQDLTTLERGVLKTLGHGSAGSPTATKVRQSILGNSRDSLKNKLSALTIGSMSLGSSITAYESTAMQEIRQNFTHVNQQVLASLASSTSSATPATS